VVPPDPLGPWLATWIYIISESFHVNMSSSGLVVLEKKIFKWSQPLFVFLWLSLPRKEPCPSFQQFSILFTHGWFVPSLIDIGLLVLEKIFFNINTCKYGFSYYGPSRSPRTMICTNLNLHYTSCRYELFLLCGSWEAFQMTSPHFCNYVPLEEDLALNLNILEFLLPKDNIYQVWLKLARWFWRSRF
jgi:hypothetical protein